MISRFPDHLRSIDMRRRTMLRLTLAMLTILMLGLGPVLETAQAAGGWLQFKNETRSRIYVAVLYRDEARCGTDGWMQRGWWNIQPGETVSTIQMSSNRNYYYFAETTDGVEWSSSSTGAWVPNSVFTECHRNNRNVQPGSDYRWVGMNVIRVEDTDGGYIMELTPPGRECGSLDCDNNAEGVSPPDDCPWYNPYCW